MMRRTVLITGASAGLGRGMALQFASRGHDLALCARRLPELEVLKAELLARHPDIRVEVRALDVTDHPSVHRVFEEFLQCFGRLDRIIVNAGIGRGVAVGEGGLQRNLELVETNFSAALAQCEAAVALFRRQGAGHLVTICSVAAIRGLPRAQTVYGATKAGLAALTEGIRADLWGSGIKVSAIYPGYIESDIGAGSRHRPFLVDNVTGSRSLVRAIESERAKSIVPAWPWVPIVFLMRHLPLGWLVRFM